MSATCSWPSAEFTPPVPASRCSRRFGPATMTFILAGRAGEGLRQCALQEDETILWRRHDGRSAAGCPGPWKRPCRVGERDESRLSMVEDEADLLAKHGRLVGSVEGRGAGTTAGGDE